ncbi:hypothetical protein JCGZ_07516 [Jatropha curcas]|uniref:SUEL-type lectin domain-containing protein n=2 Tax=Jatropha curcas TaxID=180498 RepID=A0A067KNS6_JATCU|nr:hypothetical protein JCGZ_07516 [Jatropha curcas]
MYFVPAWSVSILQGCKNEVFNSAKVNVQTSLMVKKLHENDNPQTLSWMWAPENIRDALNGNGNFRAKQLLEQKEATSDASDYLWYSTRVDHNDTIKNNVTLHVNFSGQVLYAYVNRRLIGSQWGYTFVFEKPALLNPGPNIITLLSVTVGLQNYGEFFDEGPEGIAGGPVQLIHGNTTIDLSSNLWAYKIGLHGEAKRLYDPNSLHGNLFRTSDELPVGRAMTWYKTKFQAPSGTDPVVLDLQGMGKGHAWVNGRSLGRFWPTQISDSNGCSSTCDYRGNYSGDKCLTNCGNSSQRWYHVPRSFLKKGRNTLILFEEVGGNPSNVSFQIVTVGTICGSAYEGSTLELSCTGGRIISDIEFASYGDPQGSCGSFNKGDFEATHSVSAVERACVGKQNCQLPVSNATFGATNFGSTARLAVQALCMGSIEYQARKGN